MVFSHHTNEPFRLPEHRAGSVSQEADCKKMVDTAVEKFGALHVAFNNAGVFKPAPFAEITEETIDSLLSVNVKSLAFCFKYQVPPRESLKFRYSTKYHGMDIKSYFGSSPFDAWSVSWMSPKTLYCESP